METVLNPVNGELAKPDTVKPTEPSSKPANRLPDVKADESPAKQSKPGKKPVKPDGNGLRDKSTVKWAEQIVIAGIARLVRFSIQVDTDKAHKPEHVADVIAKRTDAKGNPLDLIGKWSYLRADGSSQTVKTPREPALASKAYRKFAGLPVVG